MDALDLNEIDVPNIGSLSSSSTRSVENSWKPDVTKESVRSTAVVTYSAAKYPALFSQLAPFTNLNLAPSNWLRHAPGLRPGALLSGNRPPTSFTQKEGSAFSSFQMADSHLNYMGEIDVVSDAENIKKLLKVPYSKAHVSMAVHRIGNTLLLEQFDIAHDSLSVNGWEWFKMIYEELTQQQGTSKKKLASAQLDRLMLSKFLYYSVNNDDSSSPGMETPTIPKTLSIEETLSQTSSGKSDLDLNKISEVLENSRGTIVPAELRWKYWTPNDATTSQCQDISETFERTIFWTFEDLQMLLGTNMPIFGEGEYPAVSLRLRDSNKPINILTGIDYWLDNLICNVPEVVMCFHVNGIVQNYEVIKTEEIPHLTDTKFSPKVIKDIAQNILSFLKSNCTKEGHTYWLFKGSNDDVVKLYDLTTLCNQKQATGSSDSHNPFTISVATLLYKMAINLMQQTINTSDHNETIKKLLYNCVGLLEERTQLAPVMFDAALCMLSTLCLPDSTDVQYEKANSRPRTTSITYEDTKFNNDAANTAEIAIIPSVTELSIPEKYTSNLPSNSASKVESFVPEEGCHDALSYIIKGLNMFNRYSEWTMPEAKDCKDLMIVHMQMIRNTTLIYYMLAKRASESQRYGCSLRCINLALQSYEYLEHLIEFQLKQTAGNEEQIESSDYDISVVLQGSIPPDFHLLLPRLLALCGDIQMLQMERSLQEQLLVHQDYNKVSAEDSAIMKLLSENLSGVGQKYEVMTKLSADKEEILSTCRQCFQAALGKLQSESDATANEYKSSKNSSNFAKGKKETLKQSKSGNKLTDDQAEKTSLTVSVSRKLGHVANEQGTLEVNKSIELLSDAEQLEKEKLLWKSSFAHLETALTSFTEVNDFTNQALVLSNLGRLMRVCAQSTAQREDGKFTVHEQQLYDSAIDYYRKALIVQTRIKMRRGSGQDDTSSCLPPTVNDNISWELSGAYFTMAQRLQDHAPLNIRSQEEIEREILDLLNKSLKHCNEIWRKTEKHSLAQYRCAKIHSRLASLHHNSFRVSEDVVKKRQYRSLADVQYSKACSIFSTLSDEHLCEFLRVLLERLALREQQLPSVTNQSSKMKLITEGLDIMINCVRPLTVLSNSLLLAPKQMGHFNSTSVDPQPYKSKSSHVIKDITNYNEWNSLIEILAAILKSFLFSLLKLTVPATGISSLNSSKKKGQTAMLNNVTAHNHYKQLYSRVLRSLHETSVVDGEGKKAETNTITNAGDLQRKSESILEIITELKQ